MAEFSEIYETAVDRIGQIYRMCSPAEQKLLRDILQEMSIKGYSYTLEKVWLADFKEIPVGIDQFLDDPYYLGQTNNYGKNVYPFWRQTFHNIFNAGNRYNEILLGGATRIGKSSSSVTIMAYMLYKLMLYRNPHEYFNKKAVSRFTLAFANLTKDLAFGVGYREFNDTLKDVPWFMEHGQISRSDRNFFYIPEGDKIEIVAASSGEQLLGKQLWCCVTGDTRVLTSNGVHEIRDLTEEDDLLVMQYNYEQEEYCYAQAHAVLTKYTSETIRIELEDGTVIGGTPEHRIMLSDGSYKRLDELTEEDDILEV